MFPCRYFRKKGLLRSDTLKSNASFKIRVNIDLGVTKLNVIGAHGARDEFYLCGSTRMSCIEAISCKKLAEENLYLRPFTLIAMRIT